MPRRVVRCLITCLGFAALAVPASAQELLELAFREPYENVQRIFVDVSLGTAKSDARAREFASRFLTFGEQASLNASYPRPSRANLFGAMDLGAGLMLDRWFAVGLNYSRTVSKNVVHVTATIPHPTLFRVPASDAAVTSDALKRRESAIHLYMAFVPVRTQRAQVRFFAGPSYFMYSADMVKDVLYTQTYDPSTEQNVIAINGSTIEKAGGRQFGVSMGADVAYFLTQTVGVMFGGRISDGLVSVDKEPLSQSVQKFRVGGLLVRAGVRFRFN